jgi:hypothetical protein
MTRRRLDDRRQCLTFERVHVRASARNNVVIRFLRPRIERDGEAWRVLRGDHAWLHRRLDRAERFPWWRL